MRLEDLYENFGRLNTAMQAKYIAEYRLRRAEDLSKQPTWPKAKTVAKKAKTKKPKVQLTSEEKTLMELLGLNRKEVVALRSISEEE